MFVEHLVPPQARVSATTDMYVNQLTMLMEMSSQ